MKPISTLARIHAKRAAIAKGNSFEQSVERFLIERGWIVETVKINRRMIWNRHSGRGFMTIRADFFGCVDHIAIHPTFPATLFIQSTSSLKAIPEKQRSIGRLPLASGRNIEVWAPGVAVNDFRVWRKTESGWVGPESATSAYPKNTCATDNGVVSLSQ